MSVNLLESALVKNEAKVPLSFGFPTGGLGLMAAPPKEKSKKAKSGKKKKRK